MGTDIDLTRMHIRVFDEAKFYLGIGLKQSLSIHRRAFACWTPHTFNLLHAFGNVHVNIQKYMWPLR